MLMKFLTSCLVFALGAVTFPTLISGQVQQNFVFTGPLGVYIFTGTALGNESHVVRGIIGYRIERKESGESDWKIIAEISAPETKEGLERTFASAMNDVPYTIPLVNFPIDKIWSHLEQYHELDSLPAHGSALVERLAVGAIYLDRNVKQGVEYEYRVFSISANSTSPQPMVKGIRFQKYKAPGEIYKAVRSHADTNSIHLLWHKSDDKIPTSTNVYRKNGFGNFIKTGLNADMIFLKDTLFYSVKDSTVKTDVHYSYYLQPIDYYGNSGPSSDTITTQAINAHQIRLPDHIHAEVVPTKTSVKLSWKFTDSKQTLGIRIYRSEDITGKFKRIAEQSSKELSYIDQTIIPDKTYYYYLTVLTTKGEESGPTARVFAVTKSDHKPLAPFALSASAKDDGVHLIWHSADRNIRGFYLYCGEGIHRAKLIRLAQLIPFHDSMGSYLDSNKTLSPKKVYSYCVQALSTSDVEGALSDTARVQPRGVTIPSAPVNFAAIVAGNTIKLFWDEMRIDDPSVIGYCLYRRDGDEGEFKQIGGKELSTINNNFIDSLIASEKTYQYYVRTIDGYGGMSDNSIGVSAGIKKQEKPRPATPVGLKAETLPEGIFLSWGETIGAKISGYKIYRHESNSESQVVSSVKAEATTYLDATAKKGNIYWYSLSSENAEKFESLVSNEVRIRF